MLRAASVPPRRAAASLLEVLLWQHLEEGRDEDDQLSAGCSAAATELRRSCADQLRRAHSARRVSRTRRAE